MIYADFFTKKQLVELCKEAYADYVEYGNLKKSDQV